MKKWLRSLTKFIQDNLFLFVIVTIGIIVVFSSFIFFKRPFILLNDQDLQFKLYYTEWIRLVKDFVTQGELPFYSWYKFLGSDFYSSSALYTVGDFFLPMLLIPSNINLGLFVETLLLFYISAFAFKYFLVKFGVKTPWILLVYPMIYAFSGWAVLFTGNYMFHRFYAILPLLFAGVELWFHKKNRLVFALSVFVLMLQNYYLMFPVTVFLPIYFVYSYFKNRLERSFKSFIFEAVGLILGYIIGFLLSAVLMVPAIANILGNQRLGNAGDMPFFWEPRVWIGFFYSFISGSFPIYTEIPNMFQSGYNGHAYWYSMFATGFPILVIITALLSSSRKLKTLAFSFFAVTIVMIFILPVNSIFHGFSEPSMRISIVLLFSLLALSAHLVERIESKLLIKSALGYSALVMIMIVVSYIMGVYEPQKHNLQALMILLSVVIMVLIAHFYAKQKKVLALSLILVQLIAYASIHIHFLSESFYYYEPSLTQEYVEYYQDIDDELVYRIYIDPNHLVPTSELNLNQSLFYRYLSTVTYDSMYEPQLTDFLRWNGFDWHIVNLNDPDVLRMLGVKYYAVYDETELPNSNFEYVYDLDFLKVYRDLDYRSFGFTYSNFVAKSEKSDNLDWMNVLVVEDEVYSQTESINQTESIEFTVLEKSNNALYGTITTPSKTVLYMPIPYNKGWRVFDNGVELDMIKVQGGFIGLILGEGSHELNFQFTPIGFKFGAYLSIFGLILLLVECIRIIDYKKVKMRAIDKISLK